MVQAAAMWAVCDIKVTYCNPSVNNLFCQKSLAFNPAMLRPGAVPPKKEAAPTMASFDEPATVTTLESANKVQLS